MTDPITGPILLPQLRVRTDDVYMADWGGQLTPINGGAVQTIMRLGTRHGVTVTLPPMHAEPDGRIWAAKLRLAKLYGALLPFTQDGFEAGAPGLPVVDGAAQAGMSIALRGLTRDYCLRVGQAFSLVHTGRRYLHFVAAQVVADAAGKAVVPIFPMLRVIASDGDVCEVGSPMIQGSLGGNQVKWTRQTAPWFDFGQITIQEDE